MKDRVIKNQKLYMNANGSAPEYTRTKFTFDYELIKHIDDCLGEVEGQAYAVQAAKEYFFGINNRKNASGVGGLMVFIGPPACGKSLMGEKIARALNRPYLRIDMSVYNDSDVSTCDLFGVQKSFKAAEAGRLTGYVKAHPVCVLVVDEFDKAHANVKNRFMQIFDRGEAYDLFTDENVNFRDVIMIVTMNLGRELYAGRFSSYNYSSMPQKTVVQLMRSEINPRTEQPYLSDALISRLTQGRIVLFNRLRPEVMRRIVIKELQRNEKYYREKYGVGINADVGKLAELILLSLGENADVRTAIKTVKEFFEVNFERLVKLNLTERRNAFTEVRINFDFGNLPDEVQELYSGKSKSRVIVCCKPEHAAKFVKAAEGNAEIITADGAALNDFAYSDISAAILDVDEEKCRFGGRLFDKAVGGGIPVYIYKLKNCTATYLQRYMDKGATDFYIGRAFPQSWLQDIFNGVALSAISQSLFRSNKVIKFEERYSYKGSYTAVINISDIDVVTAKDAADLSKFVSSIQAPNVRFDDIYGANGAKREISSIAEMLRNFKKYMRLGLRLPRGVLLYGEPGTGKTMLAKALAGEAGLQFIQCNASEFMQKFIGEGARLIRETFATARRYAPCVVFIDEADTFAKSRRDCEREGCVEVLNALLSEMDGFTDNSSTPVFVVAATNFSAKKGETVLDPAFIRRFDRQIEIDLPDLDTRKRYLADKIGKYSAEVSDRAMQNIAKRSIGWSLGELDTVIQNALRAALGKDERIMISDSVLNEAFEIYSGGESKVRSEDELYGTAVHEAGHAVAAAAVGIMPSYATIAARGEIGGYVYYGDEKVTKLSRKDILDRICIMMAGRAAETVVFGEAGITSGISGDLKSATELATSMICDYGMDEEFPVYIEPSKRSENPRVTRRVAEIIKEQSQRANNILTENIDEVRETAQTLLEKVSLDEGDLQALLGDIRG